MDASRSWLYASSGVPVAPHTSTLTAKMTPVATGQLCAPLRETLISRKMPGGTQLHDWALKLPTDHALEHTWQHVSVCTYHNITRTCRVPGGSMLDSNACQKERFGHTTQNKRNCNRCNMYISTVGSIQPTYAVPAACTNAQPRWHINDAGRSEPTGL